MKTITFISLLITAIIFSSCEGPMGPPGMDGLDGTSLMGTIFEIEGDFTSGNEYKLFYEFPNDFTVYDSDIVMVYLLWEQVEISGQTRDVWRALPQSIVLQEGILQYNFDYTVEDVQIFLDGDIDFNTLLPAEKDNQVFRIAVLPADFVDNKNIDLMNLEAVMGAMEIKADLVEPIKLLD